MWTLFSQFCKQQKQQRGSNAADAMKAKTGSMDAQARHSLAEQVAQTLGGDAQDPEHGSGENVEALLARVEHDLETANAQLAASEEKEQFLKKRIHKYNQLLEQQEKHLQTLEHNSNDNDNDTGSDSNNKEHYQEQLQKQQSNKEALGQVVDIHLQILKNCKDLKYRIAALEQKRAELTNTTKQFRDFLVMAEEAEREQQAGVDQEHHDLEMCEMEPLTTTDDDGGDEKEEKVDAQEQQQELAAETDDPPDEEKAFIKREDNTEEADKAPNSSSDSHPVSLEDDDDDDVQVQVQEEDSISQSNNEDVEDEEPKTGRNGATEPSVTENGSGEKPTKEEPAKEGS